MLSKAGFHVEQLANREEELALQGCKCDDTTKADGCADGVVYDLHFRDKINNGGCNRKEDANEHEKPAPYHLLAYFQVGQVLVLLLELFLRIFLAPKGFCQGVFR